MALENRAEEAKQAHTSEVRNCARCGGTHPGVVFKKLQRRALRFDYWAMCPTTGEPILMEVCPIETVQRSPAPPVRGGVRGDDIVGTPVPPSGGSCSGPSPSRAMEGPIPTMPKEEYDEGLRRMASRPMLAPEAKAPSALTTDRADPRLKELKPNGQQRAYLVLSDEERAKGFVRPVRAHYIHKKCGGETAMSSQLAETYARDPSFYSGTFCVHCGRHFPLKAEDGTPNFHWSDDESNAVGS